MPPTPRHEASHVRCVGARVRPGVMPHGWMSVVKYNVNIFPPRWTRIDSIVDKEMKAMPLYVKAWAAHMFGSSGHLMYLPFDKDFKPNDPNPRHNHIVLSQVGRRPSWYIFVDFPAMDPHNPVYPHYV